MLALQNIKKASNFSQPNLIIYSGIHTPNASVLIFVIQNDSDLIPHADVILVLVWVQVDKEIVERLRVDHGLGRLLGKKI